MAVQWQYSVNPHPDPYHGASLSSRGPPGTTHRRGSPRFSETPRQGHKSRTRIRTRVINNPIFNKPGYLVKRQNGPEKRAEFRKNVKTEKVVKT